jgi:hypothetical protein
LCFWGFFCLFVLGFAGEFLGCFRVERSPNTHTETQNQKEKEKKERKTDVGKGREHKYKREMAIEETNAVRTKGFCVLSLRALLNEKKESNILRA